MRRAMRARLRWRPELEGPGTPVVPIVGVEQTVKGRLAAPGLLRGRIVEGGV